MVTSLALRLTTVGLLFSFASCRYEDEDSLLDKRIPEEFLSSKAQATRLFNRLQDLDQNFAKYFNLVFQASLPRQTRDDSFLSRNDFVRELEDFSRESAAPDFPTNDDDVVHLQQKRQSSSGAQICIWKVCPPSPWRRKTGRAKTIG